VIVKFIEYLKIARRVFFAYLEIFSDRKKLNLDCTKKQVYVLLAADYKNLGDIAITYSQIQFLKNNLSDDFQIIEVGVDDIYKVYLDMKKYMTKDTIITLIGGGNTGNLYEFIDQKRRFILRKFRNQKIISFPQTIYYEETKTSKIYENLFRKACSKTSNLTLIAREKKSYDIYKSMNLNASVLLTPDIVFSLKFKDNYNLRNGISFVLRDDIEKSISLENQQKIINYVKKLNIDYSFEDTCDEKMYDDNVSKNEILLNYLNNISKKQLVITDRLHGMIMCYITKTPCIVFTNNNHKIISTYNTWLGNQNFIKLCSEEDIESCKELIKKLMNLKEVEKDDIISKFAKINKLLLDK